MPLTDREFDHQGVHDAPDDGDEVERVPAIFEVTLPKNGGQNQIFHGSRGQFIFIRFLTPGPYAMSLRTHSKVKHMVKVRFM